MIPGEILPGAGAVAVNADQPSIELLVRNTGDRPIQVGSHYHLAEANPALEFHHLSAPGDLSSGRGGVPGIPINRRAVRGYRLDVPAGTSRRFEPGIDVVVTAVPLGGRRVVWGLRGETGGSVDA